jgi:hypothetical protein
MPLAGTATRADRFLVLEYAGPWGRDAVTDSELPNDLVQTLDSFDGRVMLARRPGRSDTTRTTAFVATATEDGGVLRRVELDRPHDVASVDPERDGVLVDGPLVLVCVHRRRDACCARLGVPVFNALRPHVASGLLWRSSHHGGHRFAANVLALPWGVQLGRVTPADARDVAATLADGRIPLDRYRGRTLHPPEVQAADAALRSLEGLDRIGDVRVVDHAGDRVVLAIPGAVVDMTVADVPGPMLPASCGAEPEPTASLVASVSARRSANRRPGPSSAGGTRDP